MNFQDAIRSGFRNYATFAGRASRSEYWYWVLFCLILGFATAILDVIIFPENEHSPINTLAALALFVPNLAIGARRLHDIGRSGWWQAIAVTIIGLIPLIYWFCQPGEPGDNRFGAPAPTMV